MGTRVVEPFTGESRVDLEEGEIPSEDYRLWRSNRKLCERVLC